MVARVYEALPPEREKLVNDNLGLVRHQCHKLKRMRILDYDELYSFGCEALLAAARRWPGEGKFSTYATVCIKRLMIRAIKTRRLLPQSSDDADDLAESVQGVPDDNTETLALSELNRDYARAMILALPEPQRSAIRLYFGLNRAEPLCPCEAAAELAVSESRYKRLVEDGKDRLRLAAATRASRPKLKVAA